MTEQSSGNDIRFEPLPNSAIVYRALLRNNWINEDTGRVKAQAYFLRKNRNEQGLSVNIANASSPEQCASRFTNCYGVASLDVGRVRELGLDVVPDSPSHANIIGLPYREDDPATTERLARLLAKQSRIVWQP
ncbi:hypothetical protein PI95_029470 [Hassallia byssoidea VB512170]|uniref:Uncharacterized protein n=1 Tax=Hassallia byssoidea VB512170 TaxID=1304833 RepID=A0A846HGQ0_9CYAN|nr:hypothetical protein [Hassalia byssoidea]NEU76532.1 hypothetical protein [Hassalia byssoidea VB512170]